MDTYLTSAEAARLLGVGPTSIKRWADAGLLPCVKTPGKHRRFRREDIERLMRDERGRPWMPDEQQVGAWIQLLTSAVGPFEVQSGMLAERSRCGSWWKVCDALGPVLEELGKRWEDGRLSVLQEHEASERLSRAIERCAENMPVPPRAQTCLLAAARDEQHVLGLSLAELCLRDAGWNTRWSGASTPLEDILRELEGGTVDMLAMTASRYGPAPDALAKQASLLLEACPRGDVMLVLGGRGAWPEEEREGVWRVRTFEEFQRLLSQDLATALR